MSKTLQIIGITVGGLAALLVLAGLAISAFFDPNDYKDEITAQVKARTGRALTLDGDLGLSFFPWLGIETGKATLSNAPGFGAEPFATLESASVRVRLSPLLRKRVEVGTVMLEGLRFNLVRNADGHTNWEDLLASDATEPAPESGAAPTSIAIAGLQLRDASLSWRDEQAQTSYVVEKIALETGALEPGKPIDVALALTLAGGLPGYVADLKLNGTVRSDLERSLYEIDDLRIDYAVRDAQQEPLASGSLHGKLSADAGQSIYVFDAAELEAQLPATGKDAQPVDVAARWATARFDQSSQQLAVTGLVLKAFDVDATIAKLEGTSMLDAPRLNGVLDVAQVSLSQLVTALEVALPAGMDANALGAASLHADFAAEPSTQAVRLSGLNVSALGMRVQGDVRAENGKVTGNLVVPQFATAELYRALGTTLPQDVNVKAIDKLALATAFDLDAAKHTLAVRDLKADLLGTSLLADVQVSDFGGKAPHYAGSLRVDQVEPGPFLSVFGKLVPEGLDARELGTLALNTRFEMQSSQDALQLDDLRMTLVGLQFAGDLEMSKLSGDTEYDGRLSVARFSPRALLQRFGAEVPVTADAAVLGAAEGKAHVVANTSLGRFEDVDLALDQSRIRGSFAVKDFANPAYDFDLAIDDVDVDRYLPPPTPAEKQAKNADTGDVEIPVEALKALAIGGKIRANAMKIGGIKLAKFAATLDARAGLARLDPVAAELYRGSFAGGFTADARGAVPAMTIKGKATDIAIGPFLRDLSAEDPAVTGTGSFSLELTGKGDSYKKNLASADGSVGFALRDGALKGFDLGYSLCAAYNTLTKLPQPKSKAGKKSPFESISGTAVVQAGVADTKDLEGTTKFMRVKGEGALGLADQKLDYDMEATLTAGIDIKGCSEMNSLVGKSLPLDIKGTIAEPKVLPDFGELAKRQVQKKVEDEIKDKLLDVLGNKKKAPDKKP